MTATVVDYDAWRKGYMPPSEHILIDELSYRGAKVVMSSTTGDFGFWLVIKGGNGLSKKQRKAMRDLLEMAVDEIEDSPPDVHALTSDVEIETAD